MGTVTPGRTPAGFYRSMPRLRSRIRFRSRLTISYTLNYAELESYLGGKVYYPKKSPNEILLEDKYLEKFFENKELKEYYEKNVKENRDNINTKRQFLTDNKILENIPGKENF